MPDSNPESIKAIIQGITQTNNGIVEAKVLATEPLQVQATNDDKLILSAVSLIVPQHLTNYQIPATFTIAEGSIDSQTEGDGRHSHGNSGEHSHGDCAYGGGHTHTDEGTHTHQLVTFSLSKHTALQDLV